MPRRVAFPSSALEAAAHWTVLDGRVTTINTEQIGTVRVIRLAGEFITDEAVALLKDAVPACATPVIRCVVVNWTGVESIGSVGIGAITTREEEFSRSGGYYRNCAYSKFMVCLIPHLKMWPGWKWNYVESEKQAVGSCPVVASGGAPDTGSMPGADHDD